MFSYNCIELLAHVPVRLQYHYRILYLYFTDINECANSECDHFCHNLDCQDGQYYCSCRPGYHLGSDEHTCIGKRI